MQIYGSDDHFVKKPALDSRDMLVTVDTINVDRLDSGSWLFKARRYAQPRVKAAKPRKRKYFQQDALLCRSDLARACGVQRSLIVFWILRKWTPEFDVVEGGREFWLGATLNAWESKLAWKYLKG